MPTYEYQCEKCGLEFEQFQSMKDDALTTCPKEACQKKRWGKGKVQRAIGAGAGLIFKGSGFYETDYKKKPKSENAGDTKKAEGSKDSGKDTSPTPAKDDSSKSVSSAPPSSKKEKN